MMTMSRYQLKGSEVRSYALGVLVAGIASLFIGAGTLVGIALALATISFCMDG